MLIWLIERMIWWLSSRRNGILVTNRGRTRDLKGQDPCSTFSSGFNYGNVQSETKNGILRSSKEAPRFDDKKQIACCEWVHFKIYKKDVELVLISVLSVVFLTSRTSKRYSSLQRCNDNLVRYLGRGYSRKQERRPRRDKGVDVDLRSDKLSVLFSYWYLLL